MNQPPRPIDPNDVQIGGDHYQAKVQHWDFAWDQDMDYFQGQITKYLCRWRDKNGLEDLYKARHFLDKYISLVEKDGEVKSDAPLKIEVDFGKGLMPTHQVAPPNPPLNLDWSTRHVKPTGWVDYTFEGTDGDGALFTCRRCLHKVRCPHGSFPGDYHDCGAPGPNYVNQD